MAIKQWLSDKKNIPIIAAAAVLLLVVAGVIGAFATGLLGNKSASDTAVATAPVSPSVPPMQRPPQGAPNMAGMPGRPGMPPSQMARPGQTPFAAPSALRPQGMPAAPLMPGRPTQVPSAATIAASNLSPAQKAALVKGLSQMPQMAAIDKMTPEQKMALGKKMISQLSAAGIKMPDIPGMPGMTSIAATAHTRNPFAPSVNIKQLTEAVVPPPVSSYVPFISITRLPNPHGGVINYPVTSPSSGGPAPITAPLGRVAGIINSNGIRAIYEIDGHDTIITPGSLLPENGGRVQSIQSDGITVRLPDSSQTVQVPITAGNPATQTQNTPAPQTGDNTSTDPGNPADGTAD